MHPRIPRQCRERWTQYLNPSVQNPPWTPEEDILLAKKFNEFGPRWKAITACFTNRSRNSIKNHWMTKLKHKDQSESDIAPASPVVPKPGALPEPTQDGSESIFAEPGKGDILWDQLMAGQIW
jgi:hypothetical protein